MESATALTDCELVRINKKAMMAPLHREHELSGMSTAYLLGRKEEDLVEYIVASDETSRTIRAKCVTLFVSCQDTAIQELPARI